MNPLGTRARVEELARLLDGAVSGPGSLTAGHAALATRLRAVAPSLDALAVPRAEFRATLRTRLLAVATVQAATAADAPYAEPLTRPSALDAAMSWTQTRKAQRRIGLTAGAMAGVIAFTGVGIAASRSLPGQPFYGLKRGAEGVQLQLAQGDTAKGTKHLEFASTRLREVRALAQGDSQLALGSATTPQAAGAFGGSVTSKINDTLADFDSETKTGRTLLEKVYHATGKPEPLRILTTFSSQQQLRLVSIMPELPKASRRSAEQSLQLVTDVGSTANQLLSIGTCGGECFPQGGGPTLPTEPVPAPGATATPSTSPSSNDVPPCTCVQPTATPEPTPAVEPTPTDSPTETPTESPTASPTPSPTSSPTSSPGVIPPLPLPTILPTILPTLPVLPNLPIPPVVASLLPSLAPAPKS
jgi:hypothetical protein